MSFDRFLASSSSRPRPSCSYAPWISADCGFSQNLFHHGICQDTSLVLIATLSPRMRVIAASLETLEFVKDVCSIKRTLKIVQQTPDPVSVRTIGSVWQTSYSYRCRSMSTLRFVQVEGRFV